MHTYTHTYSEAGGEVVKEGQNSKADLVGQCTLNFDPHVDLLPGGLGESDGEGNGRGKEGRTGGGNTYKTRPTVLSR